MPDSEFDWRRVDEYLVSTLVKEDHALVEARATALVSHLPMAEVSPTQGKLLWMLARMMNARRVLEFGTLTGYSAIWLARAVGPDGHVTTLELERPSAEVALQNLELAGVADRVTVMVGPAAASASQLVDQGEEPFDFVFIDADKPNNPRYLEAAMQLTRPGSVIVCDNVVRSGTVTDAGSDDERVRGVRAFLEIVAADPRLEATAIQTVGSKGWDGFAIAIVL